MRTLTIAACLLLVVLWFACIVEFPTQRTLSPDRQRAFATLADDWRRTNDGWERSTTWNESPRASTLPAASNLHPGLLASFQVLASIGSLLAFSNLESSP